MDLRWREAMVLDRHIDSRLGLDHCGQGEASGQSKKGQSVPNMHESLRKQEEAFRESYVLRLPCIK
jgi:hypothetical protein